MSESYDDYDAVKKPQKNNCIHVKEFKLLKRGGENDKYLKKLLIQLEKIQEYYDKNGKLNISKK